MNKPIKPEITIPQSFAENGVKTDFSNDLLNNGFDNLKPDVLAGDNLNQFIDTTYKGLNYGMAAADAINLINEGETLTVKDGELVSDKVQSGAGLQMFDTVLKDHILTFEESKGLALQGTYVYKEAVAGSRYGYPDFYNKCLEEYENTDNTWVQPILTANGTLGGNSFAVSGTTTDSAYPAYKAFDGDTTSDWVSASANENLIIYNPIPIKITRIDIVNRNSNIVRYIKSGTIYGSNDNSQYDEIATFTNSVTTQLGEWFIDLSVNTKHYKYYKLSMVGETYCSANQITIAANQALYKNPNGHLFYDITQKDIVDEVFESTGMAWFYGVDTENERIYLPRNNWFEQLTADGSEVGKSIEAGLPNITGTFGNEGTVTGAYYRYGGSIGGPTGGDDGSDPLVGFDASRSSSVYGNSDTVQPNAVKKLLYICVGTTEATSTLTDVVEVTTTENDTLPLGYHFYQKNAQPSISYLKSEGQWNPGKAYETFYNEFVNKIGEPFASGYVKEVTDEFGDYDLVINQDDMTFRLPLLDGSESLVDTTRYIEYPINMETHIAPANGYVFFEADTGTANNMIGVIINNGANPYGFRWQANTGGVNQLVSVPISKGDSFSLSYTTVGETPYYRFYYNKGNGSLYFKVANAVQNLELLDAGEVLESLADKISRQDCKAYVTETYQNGTSWYRVYSDGWCEQGGRVTGVVYNSTTQNLTFLKPFRDTNYTTSTTAIQGANYISGAWVNNKTTTGMVIKTGFQGSGTQIYLSDWQASGYIA